MATATVNGTTRDRLLEAAAEVFIAVGYREATFREICRRAGANIAAINYYFRDKERLYLDVIEEAIAQTRDQFPDTAVDPASPPEERLHAFIASLLRNLLGSGSPNRLLKLMAREMAEPTRGLDLVVKRLMMPIHAALSAIIRELLGPSATQQQVDDCAVSVLGQCNCLRHGWPVITRLGTYNSHDDATIEHLIDHVARFSLAGIRALARS
jgi:TetR/AcrR family transcriptional regulator, regulator of cefoperazone and chloramphenicol sensitivity